MDYMMKKNTCISRLFVVYYKCSSSLYRREPVSLSMDEQFQSAGAICVLNKAHVRVMREVTAT